MDTGIHEGKEMRAGTRKWGAPLKAILTNRWKISRIGDEDERGCSVEVLYNDLTEKTGHCPRNREIRG